MSRITDYIKGVASLKGHLDTEAAAQNIRQNIAFGGPNVYILFFAIIIASIGLNVNSIPVIIGAMLVSPLMSPILGFGLGLSTNDTKLVWSSLKNLMVMVLISIAASALYFAITPLKLAAPTELLARTNPSIYDVLIALFGGFAATLEISRKDKGTVMSGAAIATALMPPLCTAGYGIAELSWHYLGGAFYLFSINSIFIALAAFLSAKYLGFPMVRMQDEKAHKKNAALITALTVILIVPSIWSAVLIIRENNFNMNAEQLVSANKTIGGSYIYNHKVNTDSKPYTIEIFIAGEGLNEDQQETIYKQAELKGISRSQIVLRQEASDMASRVDQAEIVRGIYEYYDKRIQDLNSTITDLQVELSKYRQDSTNAATAPEVQ